MLNWLLATIAAGLWGTAYGWYFSGDVRRWLWRRRHRRQLAEIQRAQAYNAWVRRAHARGRPAGVAPRTVLPAAAAAELPAPVRPSASVIPFPKRRDRPPPNR